MPLWRVMGKYQKLGLIGYMTYKRRTNMCEYAIKDNDRMIMCAHTGKPCALCVLGNGKTFMEAEKIRTDAEKKYERRCKHETD